MDIIYFAHNGVHHGAEVEAIAHEASDSTFWLIAGSFVMAAAFYVMIRRFNRRMAEEEITQEDQEF